MKHMLLILSINTTLAYFSGTISLLPREELKLIQEQFQKSCQWRPVCKAIKFTLFSANAPKILKLTATNSEIDSNFLT